MSNQGADITMVSSFEPGDGRDPNQEIKNQLSGGDANNRTSFLKLLFRTRGSVLYRVMPHSFFGAVVAFALVMIERMIPGYWILPELKHPFIVQVYGIILGFVVVARTDVAVGRYFDGIEHIHHMSTRWVDSFTSLLGFLRSSADLHPPGSPKQEACVAVGLAMLHWGTLAHALAINTLQVTQLGIDEGIWHPRISEMEPPENLVLDSNAEIDDMKHTLSKAKSRSRLQKEAMIGEKRVSITEGVGVEKAEKGHKRQIMKLGVYGKLATEEVQRLNGSTDKVAIVLMWMEEAVSRAQVQGVILTAPPILGRVYGEIGSGLQGYNEAYRIALVPFPFCFAQMIGWCLVVFLYLCPAVAFVFTGGEFLTSFLTFCSLMGFWGLNRIAVELENPFGQEVNHLPLGEMHHAFVEALGEMHQHPMPEYQWKTPQGSDSQLPGLRRILEKK
jgi:predicted membrane chloride channel (bestrophin family)